MLIAKNRYESYYHILWQRLTLDQRDKLLLLMPEFVQADLQWQFAHTVTPRRLWYSIDEDGHESCGTRFFVGRDEETVMFDLEFVTDGEGYMEIKLADGRPLMETVEDEFDDLVSKRIKSDFRDQRPKRY